MKIGRRLEGTLGFEFKKYGVIIINARRSHVAQHQRKLDLVCKLKPTTRPINYISIYILSLEFTHLWIPYSLQFLFCAPLLTMITTD